LAKIDLYDKSYYINRELSWLEFNKRCLAEANDTTNPLLERVKFLAICYNNLDEFLMIRMPGILKTSIDADIMASPDYVEGNTLLSLLSGEIKKLFDEYDKCWTAMQKSLRKEGIIFKRFGDLSVEEKDWAKSFYVNRVHDVLTPLALDISHPFPFISNNSINVAFRLKTKSEGVSYARVKVPINILGRFIRIPCKGKNVFIPLEEIVKEYGAMLFPGMKMLGAYSFSIIRNADVQVAIDEACDLMAAVEESLEGRGMGFPVAMATESEMPDNMADVFMKNLGINPKLVFDTKQALSLSSLWEIYELPKNKLKEPALKPTVPICFMDNHDMFTSIKKKDRILFHPYETFAIVLRFIGLAAVDPNVQSIKICLYRIGNDPAIFNALKTARENGKDVSVIMELRAKFDEDRNIQWAKDLEKLGVHVVYGPVNLKVHSKLLQVVRLEGEKLVWYTHISSGNYNVSSAKQYCDISYFTANQEIGRDVSEVFNALTGYFGERKFKHLLVAPNNLKEPLLKKIEAEIESHNKHGNGHIIMKANGLIDRDIIAALYKASIAGVKVDLNIRGLCCLRPGNKDVSKNITVISIVDRFLEHSRIYYFENNGNPEMYLGSSDLMPRNLLMRVETLYPVLDKLLLKQIYDNILMVHFKDNVKARVLQEDGSYILKEKPKKEDAVRSQQWFIDHNGCWQN